MTVRQLIDSKKFEIINVGANTHVQISKPFCCDLLSIAMSKAPAGGCWITVMSNINTLAVAALTEVGCIILAEGMRLDQNCLHKAIEQGITVLHTKEPVFDTSLLVWEMLHEEN